MIQEESSSDEEIITSANAEKSSEPQEEEKQGDVRSITKQDLRRTKIMKKSKLPSKVAVTFKITFYLFQLNAFTSILKYLIKP